MIRIATPDDAGQIAEIYAPNVTDAFISFEDVPPDAAEIGRRMSAGLATYPWLVAETDGEIEGYAYAGPHHARPAYRWSVETTAYVRQGRQRRGVGRALYQRLLAILRRQGFRMAYAGVALPNPASVALHEAMGFSPVGVYARAGFKRGEWRDVGWWQLDLGDRGVPPAEPVPFGILRRAGEA